MANKQDLSGATSHNEVAEKMKLQQLKGKQWLVQGTSAITDQRLKDVFDWMVGVIMKKR